MYIYIYIHTGELLIWGGVGWGQRGRKPTGNKVGLVGRQGWTSIALVCKPVTGCPDESSAIKAKATVRCNEDSVSHRTT